MEAGALCAYCTNLHGCCMQWFSRPPKQQDIHVTLTLMHSNGNQLQVKCCSQHLKDRKFLRRIHDDFIKSNSISLEGSDEKKS